MADDEGVAALETDLRSSRECRLPSFLSPAARRNDVSDGVDRPEAEMFSRRGARETDRTSPTSKTVANPRFLTHPPGRERSMTAETGPVDSNGFGVLREGGIGGHRTPDGDASKTSFSSIESHICLSDYGSERVFFRSEDAVDDETGSERMDRRNSKNLKQKSRSDPIGEKTNDGVGLQSSLAAVAAYAQSSPVIIESDRRLFSFGDDDDDESRDRPAKEKRLGDREEVATRPQSLQLSAKTSSGSTIESPTPEDSEVSAVLRRGEDALDDRSPTSFKPPRPRISKRRPRPLASLSTAESRRTQDSGTTDLEMTSGDVQVVITRNEKSPTQSHSSSKKSTIARGPTSVESDRQPEIRLTSPELQNADDDQPSHGIRERHPSGLQDLHLAASTSGGNRSVTSIIGGSVQELYRSASPRFKNRPKGSAAQPPSTPSAPFSPSLDTILSQSTLSAFEATSEDKDKRDFILHEFYSTEKQYVEALQMLVEKYMIPMKTQCVLDSNFVDEIFYKINEIYMHHATFITFLDRALNNWTPQTTVGDIIYKNFSKQSVIECYISFIEHFPRAEKVLDEVATKSSFQKLIEQIEKETRTKLPLKAQIVKPAQRVPRYELLLKRLLDNTPPQHPDYSLLQQAERAVHELALRINSVKESKRGEDLQETLKKLELLLITDLASPDRLYLRHDMVTIPSRKDQCCVWLFSDLLVISTVKRKSTAVNRRTSLLLQSPTGHDFVENSKHKLWLKVPLECIDLIQGPETMEIGRQMADKMDLQSDYETLGKMVELTATLKCPHQTIDEAMREVFSQVNRLLVEHQLRTPPPEEHAVEINANTQDGPINLSIVFPSADKKSSWENLFLTSKQKIVQITDKKLPEFLHSLPITKTRAGMQFSCAVATEPSSTRLDREVLVCNSDGYVGHVCLLNLVPEPIVTLNTPVPGCNSRILCICAAPPYADRKRKRGERRAKVDISRTPAVRKESQETKETSDSTNDSGSSDSESVEDREKGERTGTRPDQMKDCEKSSTSPPPPSSSFNCNKTLNEASDPPVIDPSKSTVWLGTEDGCIQIFASTENIKTTKSKLKLQQSASVLAIVYLNSRVYASVANGDIVVYKRNRTDGTWDCSHPDVIHLSTSAAPVNRMIAVGDRLWCLCLGEVLVLATPSLDIETRFAFKQESKRGINCLAGQGHSVWISGKNSSKVILYHATTYEQLLEVDVATAVAQKLQSADDIIRQHKMACLRITALLCCKSMLWIGTSAGIILTMALPNITSTSTKRLICNNPVITGLPFGHTGHVRFLTCVDTSSAQPATAPSVAVGTDPGRGDPGRGDPGRGGSGDRSSPGLDPSAELLVSTLVISGGDGFENFRSAGGAGGGGGVGGGGEAAGRDDSTNHLLLWRV